jgi:hypothetical protein
MTSSIGAGGIEATPPMPAEQENLTQERIEQMTKSQEDGSPLDVGFEKKDPGTEAGEAAEVPEETDEATISPEAAVEKMEFAPAEDLMSALVEAVDAVHIRETPEVPADQSGESRDGGRSAEIQGDIDPKAAAEVQSVAAEVSTAAPTVTLEGAPEAGTVTIDRAEVAEAAGDQEDVKIDTVPLPESPLEAGLEADSLDDDSKDSIDTWPTPEIPAEAADRVDPVKIIDSNDGTSQDAPDGFSEMNDILNIESTSEIVGKLINNLPEGSDDLSNQAATNIVTQIILGESEDYLTLTQDIVQENPINITSDQTDGFLAVSLIKAYQRIHILSKESTDQENSETYFGKGGLDDMEEKHDGMNDMSDMTSLRLQMAMDRRSKFIATLSQVMKKISPIQDQLVQNTK